MINETRGTVIKGLPAAWRKKAFKPPVGGKRRAPEGTVARLTVMWAAQEEAKKSKKGHHILGQMVNLILNPSEFLKRQST